MTDAIALLVGTILRLFRAGRTLLVENLALRQQLTALKRRHRPLENQEAGCEPRLAFPSYIHIDRVNAEV